MEKSYAITSHLLHLVCFLLPIQAKVLLNLDNYRHEHSQIWYNLTVTWSFKYQYKDETVVMSVCIDTYTHTHTCSAPVTSLVFVPVQLMGNKLKILSQEILLVSNWPCWETLVVHQF